MKNLYILSLTALLLGFGSLSQAQSDDDHVSDAESLKIAAIEALMSAPADRALPIVSKVLKGNDSDDVKERALFVVSQIDKPEARALLSDFAHNNRGELQQEAIRMIGISGEAGLLAGLQDIYRDGDEDVRDAVLEAFLIADDADAVLQIAQAARTPEEFADAVETLGAMGAVTQLHALRNMEEMYEPLIQAYAIAGDTESLREYALDAGNRERQAEAIVGLAMADDDAAKPLFLQIYRSTDDANVKEAVLEAMLIADDDVGVLELFRTSDNSAEKRQLLERLVMMDSDAVWDLIDATLEGQQ
jgi:HEAT repeat protein